MKIQILSDLHVQSYGGASIPPRVEGTDLLIVAGDTCQGLVKAVEMLRRAFPDVEVVTVAGNHEYYGTEMPSELEAGRFRAKQLGVHLLQNDVVTIGRQFLETAFSQQHDRPTIAVAHYAVTLDAVAPQFQHSLLSATTLPKSFPWSIAINPQFSRRATRTSRWICAAAAPGSSATHAVIRAKIARSTPPSPWRSPMHELLRLFAILCMPQVHPP